jgi:carboxyl-terminal processing protease
MKRILFFALLLAFAGFTSCKKDKNISSNNNSNGGTVTTLNELRDTVYQYAKEEYLWYDAIPSTFNPQSYTGSNDLSALQSEVDAISQLKINPSTGKAYEYNPDYPGESKYSYIDAGQAATTIGGTGGDFGFNMFYTAKDDLRIRYVYKDGPADQKGLVRGYKVTAVEDQPVTLTTGNSSDPVLMRVSQAYTSNAIKLTLQKPDNSTFTTTVTRGTYTINPVFKYTTTTTASGKKVGYFAFGSFTTKENAQAKIDQAFSSFAASGINELVVDLRYNGGGAIETSEYLANIIAPASKTGSKMFTETYNQRMQNDDIPFLKKKYQVDPGYFSPTNEKNTFNFAKVGSLNISRVFFLVSDYTASASELLINNLKPVMDVQIIGLTTYGKPVGFFALPVGPYDLYLAMFESRNSAGQADFYQGMVPGSAGFPGKALTSDDVSKDFGDPSEAFFATALNYIEKGNYTSTGFKTLGLTAEAAEKLKDANGKFDTHEFNGLIDTRLLRKVKQ